MQQIKKEAQDSYDSYDNLLDPFEPSVNIKTEPDLEEGEEEKYDTENMNNDMVVDDSMLNEDQNFEDLEETKPLKRKKKLKPGRKRKLDEDGEVIKPKKEKSKVSLNIGVSLKKAKLLL